LSMGERENMSVRMCAHVHKCICERVYADITLHTHGNVITSQVFSAQHFTYLCVCVYERVSICERACDYIRMEMSFICMY